MVPMTDTVAPLLLSAVSQNWVCRRRPNMKFHENSFSEFGTVTYKQTVGISRQKYVKNLLGFSCNSFFCELLEQDPSGEVSVLSRILESFHIVWNCVIIIVFTCPCLEPDESIPHPPVLLFKIHFNITLP